MQRIHDRGNIGKLILDVEKSPTPLVSDAKTKRIIVYLYKRTGEMSMIPDETAMEISE